MYSNRVETVIEFVAYITETYRIEDREGEQKESQWETEAKMDYFFFFWKTQLMERARRANESLPAVLFFSHLCTCPATLCIAFPYW